MLMNKLIGTMAAAVQSALANVAPGSAFAVLQSAGAGGVGWTTVNFAVQASGTVLAVVGLGSAAVNKVRNEDGTSTSEGRNENAKILAKL